jgi:hypothetical protein
LQKVVRNIPLLPNSLADNIADQIDYDNAKNKYKDTAYESQYHNTKVKTTTKNDLVNIVASNVNAGNNLAITSTNNTTLQASNLNSGTADTAGTNSNVTGSTTINSNNLNILAGTSYNTNTVDKRTGKTMAIRNNTTGNMATDYTNSNLTAKNDAFTFNVTNQADIRAKDLTDPTITQPSYVAALKAQVASDKISETNLAIANKHWEETTRQLTETGTAVIAVGIVVAVVAVTILTAGAGAAPATAGAGAGVAAAGTAATAGGAAVATGATVATGAGVAAGVGAGAAAGVGLTLAGAGTVAGMAAATTALTTATISATNAGMNADGDFFKTAKTIGKTTWDDTTSKDSIEQIAISAGTALLTYGATQGLNGTSLMAGNSANATLSQQITTALAESAISTTASTAVQSSVNGDSFSEALENQGQNVLIGAIGNLGAKQIGVSYKTGKIEKPTQLALHAGLGCAMGAAGGGDCASGAVSGVTGELAGMALYDSVYGSNPTLTKDQAAQLAGAAGGLSAIFTGNAVGLSDEEVADNIFSGQRIGDNAARNNALLAAARDLATRNKNGDLVGSSGPGTHQFSILAPDNPEDFAPEVLKKIGVPEMQDLGNGKMGWVVGAHKRVNNVNYNLLLGEFNEASDFIATQEFMNPDKYTSWHKRDFDTEAYKVNHPGLTDTQVITNVLKNTINYQNNMVSIPYPRNLDTAFKSSIINSNSWNQSILKHSGATDYPNNFKGVDVGSQNLLTKQYFETKNE